MGIRADTPEEIRDFIECLTGMNFKDYLKKIQEDYKKYISQSLAEKAV